MLGDGISDWILIGDYRGMFGFMVFRWSRFFESGLVAAKLRRVF